MINWDDFEDAAVSQLNREISRRSNPDQNRAIQAPLNQSLFIVAGPGSGKTTVIALRVLKLIFIDDTDASNILVTTFTRKAAAELRSRILGWGDRLRRSFISHPSYHSYRDRLRRLDLNRIITGTLDSIAEETLGDYRAPGVPPPVVIEDFVSNALMIRVGLFSHGRHNNQDLRDYIASLRGTPWGLNVAEISATLREIKDRFFHDQIEVDRFRNNSSHRGVPVVCDAIHNYIEELENRSLFDFARIEQEFLDKLRDGRLDEFLQNIKFFLVDEYQDTNLLQEHIYFELANSTLREGGSITAVGDDDQSLYRFRGATVDLFEAFQDRINNRLGINPTIVHLSRNYRSTPIIIDFCEGFVNLDRQFQGARVQNKPQIRPGRPQPYTNYAIFGMFRTTINVLAHDLTQFIHRVIRGGGVQISDHQGNQYTIRVHPQHGTPADIALLSLSPQEFSGGGRQRLPLLLRNELRDLDPPMQVFNPRGQSLETILDVQVLCGLVLECIDPDGRVQNSTILPQDATNMFNIWRRAARDFMSRDPSPSVRTPYSLRKFVSAWQKRTPLGKRTWEEREETPLLYLIYKLITWIPNMQNDIEDLVYLEATTRTISQVGLFGDFGGQIIFDRNNPRLERASIKEALWNIFVPIASGAIEIEEDLLETLPPDRVNIMSIHQAKGLEFPLVIVDVGSDFRGRHRQQAFLRFPTSGGREHNMENELRPFSPLRGLQRPVLDRAFDDLIRKYFVAYSRAQDVLLLVGLTAVKDRIQNVATGWDRAGNWHWTSLSNLVHI